MRPRNTIALLPRLLKNIAMMHTRPYTYFGYQSYREIWLLQPYKTCKYDGATVTVMVVSHTRLRPFCTESTKAHRIGSFPVVRVRMVL